MRLVFISPATATTALRITSAVKASTPVLSAVGITLLSFTERHEIPLNDLCYPGPNVHFCLTPSRRAFTGKSAEHSTQNKRDYWMANGRKSCRGQNSTRQPIDGSDAAGSAQESRG